MVLRRMENDAKDPSLAMGDDSPLPNMAERPRPVHHFLRQRFAQVTNPPIDHLRERLVMSLRTLLGPRGPILVEGPEAARLLVLKSFFVYPSLIVELLSDEQVSVFGAAPPPRAPTPSDRGGPSRPSLPGPTTTSTATSPAPTPRTASRRPPRTACSR